MASKQKRKPGTKRSPKGKISRPLSVRDRVLESATRLFGTQGFGETGINQIIAEAGVAKASFYDHFPSKERLGQAYMDHYGAGQLSGLAVLMERYNDPTEFVRAWTSLLRRQARTGTFCGCPMANLLAQIPEDAKSIQQSTQSVSHQTIELLHNFLEDCKQRGKLQADVNPRQAALNWFIAYEGALQVWRLTNDAGVLNQLQQMALYAITPRR